MVEVRREGEALLGRNDGACAYDDGVATDRPEDEDSATLFIPPELYERMLVTPRPPQPTPPPPSRPSRPEGALFERRDPDEATLASARDIQLSISQGEASVTDPTHPCPSSRPRAPMAMPAAAPAPEVTQNGTLLMQAMPYLVQERREVPPAPPTPEAFSNTPESARVRRALDEMSMVIDIQSMPRRLASSSDEQLSRYVEALRASEGLPQAGAPPPPAQTFQHPPPGQGPWGHPQQVMMPPMMPANPMQHVAAPYPQAYPPPMPQGHHMGGHPGHYAPSHAVPAPFHAPTALPAQMQAGQAPPLRGAPTVRPPRRGAAAMAMFTVMFLLTLAGVGAVTYVALRGGHLAQGNNSAAATQRPQ